MKRSFSSLDRSTYLSKLTNQELDLLIIGGGITGVGIALDAQSRGLSTGLVEMQDFAAGTSSRSTKLVHGGLRYLKQFELKLVAEVGKERAIVYENAPHVTTPEWMLLPIIKGGTFGKFATSIGLKVYDFLAEVKKAERRTMLNKNETLEKEPLLRNDHLKGSGYYVEYKTDDARLTLEILKEAVDRGATAVSYVKAEAFIYENGKVVGVEVIDQLTRETRIIKAKKIVNAAGPWVDTLRDKDQSKLGKTLYLTKGVHIVVDQKRFPLRQAVYFDTEDDGRMIFAIPRDNKTYIGTTDTYYDKDLVNPRITVKDQEYVINAVNAMFPSVNLGTSDIESSWSGLRPLIYEEGKNASEISRKDEVFISKSGLLSIAGGKLTGYRKMAEKIVDIVGKQLGLYQPCTTRNITLSGGNVGGSNCFEQYLTERTEEGLNLGLSASKAQELTKRYGSNVTIIYQLIKEKRHEAKKYQLLPEIFAELLYGINYEMVISPIDFFHRRTGKLLFDIKWVNQWKDPVLDCMKELMSWSEEDYQFHYQMIEKEIEYATLPLET